MATSLIKFGILGAISLGGAFLVNSRLFRNGNQQLQPEEDKPIQQIIKDVYLRINTKENMAVVKDMYSITCLNSEKLVEPYEYTLKTGGKKIRLIMAVIVSEMFIGVKEEGKVPKQVIQVGGLIELLHSASLIIDDIEDGSLQRRGMPCSHLVYGLDRSINAANFMYFLPFRKLYDSTDDLKKKLEILKIFVEEMTVSHMGQAQDVRVHKVKSS